MHNKIKQTQVASKPYFWYTYFYLEAIAGSMPFSTSFKSDSSVLGKGIIELHREK